MVIDDCFKIGYVARTHGLKGEVTLMIDSATDWAEATELFLEINGNLVPHQIEKISGTAGKPFLKFDGIDNIDDAAALKGSGVYVLKSTRTKLKNIEFYDDEVVGFKVQEKTVGSIGIVREVQRHGANRIIAIDSETGEILVPVNAPFIKSINRSKKTILLELPEGFVDV
jgi:16S rRNA processing protein RimM